MKTLIPFLIALLSFNLSAASATPPPSTVESVDLNRYIGAWYEIASIPQWFQKKCVKGVMANYSLLPNGRVQVANSCITKKDEKKITLGEAKVVDSKTNAKLKVTFAKIFGGYVYAFGGDYWVIDLDPNYNYSVVGHPTREFGWILSRQPKMADADLIQISENLKKQGYDTCKFNMSLQEGGNSQSLPLCEYVKSLSPST